MTYMAAMAVTSIATVVLAACGSSGGSPTATSPAGQDTQASQTGSATGQSSAATSESQTSGAQSEPGAANGEPIKVGVALAGPRNDGAFYQSYYDGVMDLKDKYNLQVSVVDNLTDSSAIADALSNLAQANQIVIGGGSALVPPANSLAANYPKTTFVMSGKVQDGIPNLHAYNMLQGIPAYVAGVVAAKVSKAGKIGFIGGATIPSTSQSDIDFEAGAKSVNPNIQYSHVTVGSFSDAAKGQQAASAQIADGVDVIYAFLDAGLPGVIKAIDESGKDVKLFNPTTDRCDESPHIIGYDMQNLKALVADIFRDYTAKQLAAGTKNVAIEDKDVQWWTMCPNAQQWQATADGVADQINAGKVTMPKGGM